MTMCTRCRKEGRFSNKKGSSIKDVKCSCGGVVKTMNYVKREGKYLCYRRAGRMEFYWIHLSKEFFITDDEYSLKKYGVE